MGEVVKYENGLARLGGQCSFNQSLGANVPHTNHADTPKRAHTHKHTA